MHLLWMILTVTPQKQKIKEADGEMQDTPLATRCFLQYSAELHRE